MKTALIAAVMVALLTSPAAANTGNQFYDRCKTPVDLPMESFCEGYMAGLVGGWVARAAVSDGRERSSLDMCIPEGVAAGQVFDIVLNYLKDHPEKREALMSFIVAAALSETWPCGAPSGRD